MKKEIAKLWIDELRSGKYEQGKLMLRENDRFCCLGILCEMAAEAGAIEPPRRVPVARGAFYVYAGDSGVVADPIRKWAGLQTAAGVFDGYELRSLAKENDSGATFLQIADLIEQNVEAL